jgi:hypothetical protein
LAAGLKGGKEIKGILSVFTYKHVLTNVQGLHQSLLQVNGYFIIVNQQNTIQLFHVVCFSSQSKLYHKVNPTPGFAVLRCPAMGPFDLRGAVTHSPSEPVADSRK